MTRTRYCVTANVEGIGNRQHVVTALTPSAAWERFQRAYSGRACIHIKTVESEQNGRKA